MKRVQAIQLLRGVAALGVVLFHCTAIENKYFGGNHVLPRAFAMGQSGVDLFFVISGFVMVIVTGDGNGRPTETLRFLWARLTRIYPTYWFYFLLTVAVFMLRPEWVNASQGHQFDFLASFLLLPSDRLPLVMVAWSLVHELWFYVVFAAFICFPRRLLALLLLAWAALVVAASLLLTEGEHGPAFRIALHPYSIEFIAGALGALFLQRTGLSLNGKELILAMTGVVVSSAVVFQADVLDQAGLGRAAILGLLYAFATIITVLGERSGSLRIPTFAATLGDASYSIYLSHLLLLSGLGRLLSLWLGELLTPLATAALFVSMLVAVLMIGLLAYRLVELPLLRWSHRLRPYWFGA